MWTDLAVIFRPGIISHPEHELSPDQHQLSQQVLEFLIAHQDWFLLDIPPPPANVAKLSPTGREASNAIEDSPVLVQRPSSEEQWAAGRFDQRPTEARKSAGKPRTRRRATSASGRSSGPPSPLPSPPPRLATPVLGGLVEGEMGTHNAVTVNRRKTLPARPPGESGRAVPASEERHRKVLKKKAARISVNPNHDSG